MQQETHVVVSLTLLHVILALLYKLQYSVELLQLGRRTWALQKVSNLQKIIRHQLLHQLGTMDLDLTEDEVAPNNKDTPAPPD